MCEKREAGVKGGGTGAPSVELTLGAFNVLISSEGWIWIECTTCGSSWVLPTSHILDMFAAEHLIAIVEANILCARCGDRVSIDDVVALIPESMVPPQNGKDWNLYEEFNRIKAKRRDEHRGTLQKAWDYATRRLHVGGGWPGIHFA